MQDVIELIRVTKNAEMGYVDKVKKVVEWRDVISIEEAGQEIYDELEQDNLVMLTLSYGEIVIQASYTSLKEKWLKFRKEAKEIDSKLNNFGSIN